MVALKGDKEIGDKLIGVITPQLPGVAAGKSRERILRLE
jgi:hypothetical protein